MVRNFIISHFIKNYYVDEMKDEMGGAYNVHSRRDIYKILVLEPEGNSPLGRHWHSLELTLKSLSLHRL
jgi:hypothetical protein